MSSSTRWKSAASQQPSISAAPADMLLLRVQDDSGTLTGVR
jgi:hypothetical protein